MLPLWGFDEANHFSLDNRIPTHRAATLNASPCPRSQAYRAMLLDTDRIFEELHAHAERFRAAMLDIEKYSTDRQEALGWIDTMRLLSPMPSDPDKQRSSQSTNISETKTRASCTCADIPAFEPGQRHFRLTSPGGFGWLSALYSRVLFLEAFSRKSVELRRIVKVLRGDLGRHTHGEGPGRRH